MRPSARRFPGGSRNPITPTTWSGAASSPGTEAWEAIGAKLTSCAETAFSGRALPRFTPLEDDAGVMYLALEDERAGRWAAVYVRNSGTESRTGVVMRGPLDWEESLCAAGEEVLREILRRMKG